MKAKIVRKAYGKPWTQILKEVEVSRELLEGVGKLLVKHVVKEARADLARQGNKRTPIGMPEGIPASEKFFDSFSWKLSGPRTVDVVSTWPWIRQILDGRRAFRMKWLTRAAGRDRVPLRQEDGTVVIRMAPDRPENAWIHPGFDKHNFVDRAFRKAKKDVDQHVYDTVFKALKKSKSTNFK